MQQCLYYVDYVPISNNTCHLFQQIPIVSTFGKEFISLFRNYNHSAKFGGTCENLALLFLGHPVRIEVCLNDAIDFDANSVYWRQGTGGAKVHTYPRRCHEMTMRSFRKLLRIYSIQLLSLASSPVAAHSGFKWLKFARN